MNRLSEFHNLSASVTVYERLLNTMHRDV